MPLTMYTTQWCGFCRRLKAQLGRVGVEMALATPSQENREAGRGAGHGD